MLQLKSMKKPTICYTDSGRKGSSSAEANYCFTIFSTEW